MSKKSNYAYKKWPTSLMENPVHETREIQKIPFTGVLWGTGIIGNVFLYLSRIPILPMMIPCLQRGPPSSRIPRLRALEPGPTPPRHR